MRYILKFFGYYKLIVLSIVLFLSATIDLAGIAIFFPYLSFATNPEQIVEKYHLQPIIMEWGINNLKLLTVYIGILIIGFYTLKFFIINILNKYQNKVIANFTYRLTEQMYGDLLKSRYGIFQRFPASELMGVVYNNPIHASLCVSAIATIANETLFVIMLLIGFVWISPIFSLIVITTLFLAGMLLYLSIIKKTQAHGKAQATVENKKHKLAFATISAIKDIKIMGIEEHFKRENNAISKLYYETTWRYNFLGSIPKLAIEYLVLFGLCIGVMVIVQKEMDVVALLPFLGVLIASLMRIAPAYSRIIGAVNTYKFYRQYLTKLIDFRSKMDNYKVNVKDGNVVYKNVLEVKNLTFSYENKIILSDVSLTVKRGTSVGIVGMSGSGKSTLLDLLTGLHDKVEGVFLFDGHPVSPFHTNAVRKIVGYVPQNITLIDETIAFNITFSHEYDKNKLMEVLKTANLETLIDGLVEKEQTLVGENGIRLSGGQKQRIGIARALYRDPEILIFDEATSAVDNITEKDLTKEIKRLAGVKTLIIVAHRLSTIEHCDQIFLLHEGKNNGSGTYEELLETNSLFQKMHSSQEDLSTSNSPTNEN